MGGNDSAASVLRVGAAALAGAVGGAVVAHVVAFTGPPNIQPSPRTGEAPWAVRLDSATASCSGVVLSRRWILTARHCVPAESGEISNLRIRWAPTPNTRPRIYRGAASSFPYPSAPGGDEADDDIALIRLAGALSADTGAAALLVDPWSPSGADDLAFVLVGWGQDGTNNQGKCRPPTRRKRLGEGFDQDPPGTTYTRLHAKIPSYRSPCNGDSGAPWLYERERDGQGVYVAIGVHLDRSSLGGEAQMNAVPMVQRWEWIETTTSTEAPALNCPELATDEGDAYRQCALD